jgi:hypothetical protein
MPWQGEVRRGSAGVDSAIEPWAIRLAWSFFSASFGHGTPRPDLARRTAGVDSGSRFGSSRMRVVCAPIAYRWWHDAVR